MSELSRIDERFLVKEKIEKEGIRFYNADEAPFKVYGLIRDVDKYRRMPKEVAKTVSEGVYALHANAAGGRVRFVTDSPYVAIRAKMDGIGKGSNGTMICSAGFDLYDGDEYISSYMPPLNIEDGFESIVEFEESKTRQITINFPPFSNVCELLIGLDENACAKEAQPYKNEKPIVYYGSSITQGGCASRPGMTYQSILSRRLGYDYINLGFSGSAKAEDEIIEYIKNLDMSIFFLDYDHNAPTKEHLEKTHEKMFKAVRENHKDIPIIIMSRPIYSLKKDEMARRDIIENTYKNAVLSGDKNVYFIDGPALTELCKNEGIVDGCHPTDFGFASMANAIEKLMRENDIKAI